MTTPWQRRRTHPGRRRRRRPPHRDFAATWQAADKVVFSTTLASPVTRRTRIERAFDPAALRELKAHGDRDLLIGGPHLAAQALRAGLVDECRLFVVPVVVGRGKPAFAEDLRLHLELGEERHFDDGTVYLRYRTVPPEGDRPGR